MVEELKIENCQKRDLFGGSVEVLILGKDRSLNSVRGWSLSGLNSQTSFEEPDKQPLLEFLKRYAKIYDIKTFLAPIASPIHNGKLNSKNMWNEVYNIGDNVKMKKGANFEGCEVKEGEAFVMSPADCLTVVVSDKSHRVFAMHAGRESIFNASDLEQETLVENIIKAYPGTNPDDLSVWAGFGIKAGKHFIDSFEDPIYGELNKKRMEYLKTKYGEDCFTSEGYIDLQKVLYNICGFHNLKNVELDTSFHTYSGEDEENRKYYTNRGGDKSARNLVIVRKK